MASPPTFTDIEILEWNQLLIPSSPQKTAELPEGCGQWAEDKPGITILHGAIPFDERILAARAASDVGLVPKIVFSEQEAWRGAEFLDAMKREKRPCIAVLENGWPGLHPFTAVSGLPILTPASADDIQGALDWALESSAAALVVHPGKHLLAARAVLRTPWNAAPGCLVRETPETDGGSILLVVPGTMAREAIKAADRLAKIGYTAAVLSMRFLENTEDEAILAQFRRFHLVLVTDPEEGPGGLRLVLGLPLIAADKDYHSAVLPPPKDGRALAHAADALHREIRFRRTVDDIREDRWR